MKEAAKSCSMKDAYYSYASLFGVNSIDQALRTIFESRMPILQAGSKLCKDDIRRTWKTIYDLRADIAVPSSSRKSSVYQYCKSKLRLLLRFQPSIPYIRSDDGLILQLRDYLIRDQVICLDDIERRGKDLRLLDVFGLASRLSNESGCRVILIMNEDALKKADVRVLGSNADKTFDLRVQLNPTPAEASEIAFPASIAELDFITTRCSTLGITNIRLLRRILALINELDGYISHSEPETKRDVLGRLILFCWIRYCPLDAPSQEFCLGLEERLARLPNEEENFSMEESKWAATLAEYGFRSRADIDSELLEGIKNGYFEKQNIELYAQTCNQEWIQHHKSADIQKAWELFHGSFDDNSEEFIRTMYEACSEAVGHVGLSTFEQATAIIRDLGDESLALELENKFLILRAEEFNGFKLSEYQFSILNRPFLERLEQSSQANGRSADLGILLIEIAEKRGWGSPQEDQIQAAEVLHFKEVFIRLKGEKLRAAVRASLYFDKAHSSGQTSPAERARAALIELGKQSRINARRILKFGLRIPGSSN